MFSCRNEENRIWGKGTKCKPSIKILYFLYSHTATLSLLIKTIFLLSAAIFPESKLQHQERWHRVWRIDCKPFREHQKLQKTASTCVESLFKWRVVSTRDFGSGRVFMCSRHAHTHTHTHGHANTAESGSELIMLSFNRNGFLWARVPVAQSLDLFVK